MIFRNNTYIVIEKSERIYSDILNYFMKNDNDDIKPLYIKDEDENLLIDRGLQFLLPKDVISSIVDVSDNELDVEVEQDYEYYRNILDNIVLRDDQILSVIKSLLHKRGIISAATGSGKTIVIAAILKYFYMKLGYYPDCLIMEPTNYLVKDMYDRFKSYGIDDISIYSEHRGSINGITISHPKSVYNDINKYSSDCFDNVKILMIDEVHHQSCNTWNSIYHKLEGLEVSLGFSASVVSYDKLPIDSINKLTYEECVIMGCTGSILINYPPSYFIKRKILAKPVLFMINNPADEFVYDDKNWHVLQKFKIESKYRTDLAARIASEFSMRDYKILILVSTKMAAYKFVASLYKYNVADKCVVSFGGGTYLKLVGESLEDCSSENPKEKFNSGEFNIMVGTQHIYEGMDVPNLDGVILYSVGKASRKLIQGVGRSLRLSKHTKDGSSYIFDFTDHQSPVLRYHSNLRYNMYINDIGVNPEDIYNYCTIDNFKKIFNELES